MIVEIILGNFVRSAVGPAIPIDADDEHFVMLLQDMAKNHAFSGHTCCCFPGGTKMSFLL